MALAPKAQLYTWGECHSHGAMCYALSKKLCSRPSGILSKRNQHDS